MFTVMFFDGQSKAHMEQFSLLFNPYCSEGKIAVAQWNTEGSGFNDTFPDLFGILKGKDKWRALFVIEPECLNCKNVYDRPNHVSGKIYAKFEEEEDYVIRAAQILGGIHRKVRTKIVKDLRDRDGDLLPPMIQTEPVVPPKELLEQYFLPVIPPVEIAFFSKRMEHDKEAETLQNKLPENEDLIASLFYERNNYPKICRFIVFDIVDSTHIDYRFMLLKFYSCILTYAINDIEPSLLQAYRLYRMDCTIDDAAMQQFLSSAGSRITTLIDALKTYDTYTDMPKLDPDQRLESVERIPLVYENCDYSRLRAGDRYIGLVKNAPLSDETVWNKQAADIMREFGFFLKIPDRALSLAASEARTRSKLDIRELKALDRFQMEDYEEFVEKTGNEVFAMDTVTLFDKKGYYRTLSEKERAVTDEMSKRMTAGNAVRAFLAAAAMLLLGLAPIFVFSAKTGAALSGPVAIALFSLGIIAAGGLLMLRSDKRRLKSCIARFNAAMNGIINEISAAMDTFSDYLSRVCAFIKGQAALEELKNIKTNRDLRDSRVAERLLYAYQLRRQYEGIAECMDTPPAQYEIKQYYDDLNLLMFYRDIGAQLLTPVLPDKEKIGIFNTEQGEASNADAPYRFVSSVSLRYEELYEQIPKEILK